MDRSRIPVALALALAVFSIVLAAVRIGRSSQESSFTVERSSFFDAGRSGIARIRIHGMIQGGKAPGEAGSERIIALIREAEQADAIRGVILDIDSGGGETGATKQVYEAVKELKKKKPVITVIGGVAASGGYYIASASDRIFALETSIVGSIGVISLHPNIAGLLDKVGIRMQTMKTGPHKDSSYPFRDLSAEEQQMYADLLDDSYRVFIADVSEGRKQSQKTVEEWADGKIYSGKKAKALQMIDDIGGEREALAAMKLLLKTDEDLPIYEPEPDFFEELFSSFPSNRFQARMPSLPASGLYYLYPSADLVERFLSRQPLIEAR